MAIPGKEEGPGDNAISLLFSCFFSVLVAVFGYSIFMVKGSLPTSIPIFDFFILILASFRLTRLFVYDSIAQFVRDVFIDKSSTWDSKKEQNIVSRNKPKKGIKRKFYELFACPWCFGVWITFVVVFFYFVTPVAWFILLALAIAGVSTLIQLLANLIGWHAEGKKLAVQREEKK